MVSILYGSGGISLNLAVVPLPQWGGNSYIYIYFCVSPEDSDCSISMTYWTGYNLSGRNNLCLFGILPGDSDCIGKYAHLQNMPVHAWAVINI